MSDGSVPEVLFYHLETRPLEQVLPELLEKTMARGWRAVIQAPTSERIEALDQYLWTYRDDSFLPHGRAEDGDGDIQPIYLTTEGDNPNGAAIRFFVDGSDVADKSGYQRLVHFIDGADGEAVAHARGLWKEAANAGHAVTYWRQNDQGAWQKQG